MFGPSSQFLNPVHYFSLSCNCHYLSPKKALFDKTYLLPSTEHLTGETSFAKVFMSWNEKGLSFQISAQTSSNDSESRNLVELFIDTRDVKTSGFNTRFCHHFFFTPNNKGSDEMKGEKTHFRNQEDAHKLCLPEQLMCETKISKTGYDMKIFIPAESLTGYEPTQFNRLGFTYKISSSDLPPQHFSASSKDYSIDEQPALWASLNLIKD